MNEIMDAAGEEQRHRQVTRPAVRRLAGRKYPVIYLNATAEQPEQYQEIMAIDDIDYVMQALSISALLNGAIDIETGRFDSARGREIIRDYNQMLPAEDKKYQFALMNTYQSTVMQENSLVSGMIDKILDVLKNAIGVALGQSSVDQVTAAVTDAFTNLKSQDGDAWIFWEKKEAHKTVYSYAILFAIQDATTGKVMLAFPMSLEIEVNVEYERVLWITVTDKHSYSVKIDAMKIAQLLYPKSSVSDTLHALARARRNARPEADNQQLMAPAPITNISVRNWAGTILFATALTGTHDQTGALVQIIAALPNVLQPLIWGQHYMVHYDLNGARRGTDLIFNGTLPGGDIWFVSM
jgi:hypothetical protein